MRDLLSCERRNTDERRHVVQVLTPRAAYSIQRNVSDRR